MYSCATTANFSAMDIHYSTAINTSPLCKYHIRTSFLVMEVLMRVVILWFIGFYGAVHWISDICWKGLGVTLSGRTFL